MKIGSGGRGALSPLLWAPAERDEQGLRARMPGDAWLPDLRGRKGKSSLSDLSAPSMHVITVRRFPPRAERRLCRQLRVPFSPQRRPFSPMDLILFHRLESLGGLIFRLFPPRGFGAKLSSLSPCPPSASFTKNSYKAHSSDFAANLLAA